MSMYNQSCQQGEIQELPRRVTVVTSTPDQEKTAPNSLLVLTPYITELFSRLITQTLSQTRRPGCGSTEREILKSGQLQSTSLCIVKND